jgi:hypothetical protein
VERPRGSADVGSGGRGGHRRGQWSSDDVAGAGRHRQTEEEKKEGAAALGVGGSLGMGGCGWMAALYS